MKRGDGLIENVPQLLTAKGSFYIRTLQKLLPDFQISFKVLNSADYGSAQSRDRAYVIGSRIGQIDFPKKLNIRKTVKDAFSGITPDMPNALDISKPTQKTVERMSYVPQGGNYLNIPENLRTKGKFSNNFRRLSWNEPSCTIVNVARTIIIHPEENRVPSVRELARLYGFPDTFEFKGTMFDKQQQVANTVVIDVVREIAKQIKNKFSEVYDNLLMNRFSLNSL